jgi:lysophospholipase
MNETVLQTTELDSNLALAPSNGIAYSILTADDVKLRIAVWTSLDAQKGSIFILPGRADFIEKQGHAITELYQNRYTVCAIDFRGLGLSDRQTADRRAGYVKRFSDYQHDIHALVTAAAELNLPKPWNMLGNSMGGAVGLRAMLNGSPFDTCAFTSPMWGVQLSDFQHLIAPPITAAIRAIGLGHMYAPGKNGGNETLETSFEENEITGDPDMYTHLQNVNRQLDDHWIGGPTISWLNQALHETKSLSKQPSPSVRCIAFSAENDRLVENAAISSRMAQWKEGQHIHVPSARHDLLRAGTETRKSVLSSILEFFDG